MAKAPMSLTLRTRAIFAVSVTLSTLLIHSLDPVVTLIQWISGIVKLTTPAWAANPLALVIVALLVFLVLSTRVGWYLYQFWKEIEERIAHKLPPPTRRTYTLRDREYTLRKDMSASLRESDFMFAVLVSGYAMRFRDEHFLWQELQSNMSPRDLHQKQFRFLFLDPATPEWRQRAEWLVSNRRDIGLDGIDGYRNACIDIRFRLEQLTPTLKTAYYTSPPTWRLYIFRDRIYASRYSGPPDSIFEEGHRTTVVAVPSGDAMYDWLYREFKRLAPSEWWQEVAHGPFEN